MNVLQNLAGTLYAMWKTFKVICVQSVPP